jgi:hypothetical protein
VCAGPLLLLQGYTIVDTRRLLSGITAASAEDDADLIALQLQRLPDLFAQTQKRLRPVSRYNSQNQANSFKFFDSKAEAKLRFREHSGKTTKALVTVAYYVNDRENPQSQDNLVAELKRAKARFGTQVRLTQIENLEDV